MCTHETRKDVWVESPDGEEYDEWQTVVTRLTVDLDTFRYQCTACKKIMFYSGGGEQLFKEGGLR